MKNQLDLTSFILAGIICILFPALAQAQVKASFSSTTASGCTPVVTKLNDSSTGNPTWWIWDLGNGGTSIEQNPEVIYITPGSYNITLIAGNETSADTLKKIGFIHVYSLPAVSFGAATTTGCLPLAVSFINKSVANSGTVSECTWDFGDGNFSKSFNPDHNYTHQGAFNVTLSVVNSFGCKQSLGIPNYIKVPISVKADFNYNYNNVCEAPAKIDFINTTVSNVLVSHSWSFGDGGSSTELNPSHTFYKQGDYKVMLIAKTAAGCVDTTFKSISIGVLTADFTAEDSVCAGQVVTFKGIFSPIPQGVTWAFDDSTTSDDHTSIVHAFSKAGSYKIDLTADFGSCISKVSKIIVVSEKVKPVFALANKVLSCQFPLDVDFVNSTVGATSFKWLFGDGKSSAEVNPTHSYSKAGKYNVSLISFNSNGCSDTLTIDGLINAGPPKIDSFTNVPVRGCAPKLVNFAAAIDSADTSTTYLWSFGDGSVSNLEKPVHVYSKTGTYNVSLTINSGTSCASSYTLNNAVELGSKPVAGFSAAPRAICASTPVSFSDQSSKDVSEWAWFFGDGGASAEQNPGYRYVQTGFFDVTLIASNKNCSDTITLNKYIEIFAPIAKFATSIDCSLPYQRVFNNTSIGAKSWFWDFGDGDTSTDVNTGHIYKNRGTYVVSLKVTNGECESTSKQTIRIIDDSPVFSYVPVGSVCRNDVVTFTSSGYKPADYASVLWKFGDGSIVSSGTTTVLVKYRYKKPGKYRPLLALVDVNNCPVSVVGTSDMTVYGPTASFGNVAGTCVNNAISFIDSAATDGIHPIVNWKWSYGDGVTENKSASPFTHVYSKKSIYNVSLKVTDSYGCSDSIVKLNTVRITKPVATFIASDTISCANNQIIFTNKSSVYAIASLEWNFGDGTASTFTGSTKKYTTQGTFDVSLKVEDKFGCRDSIIKRKYINIVSPVASFSLIDTTRECPPLLSEPKGTSENYKSLVWKFGDGSSSTLVNPQHFYNIPGIYELKLIVRGYGNCYDSTSKKIVVKGPWGTLNYLPVSGCAPIKVVFKSEPIDVAEFMWDFNNGVVEHTKTPFSTYTYTIAGSYLPKLVLVDSAGCKVSIEKTQRINVSHVDAGIKSGLSFINACDTAIRVFNDSSRIYNDLITAYHWDFGDNKTSDGKTTNHFYTKSGIYNVSLSITSKAGCKDTASVPVTVTINKSPSFTVAIKDSVCEKSAALFTAVQSSSVAITNWSWNFGDGNSSTLQNSSHSYNAGGKYTASLKALSVAGCSTIKTIPVYINALPIINAGADTVICFGSSVTLKATGGVTYTWNASSSLSCFNCATPVAKPAASAWFTTTGANAQGCKASDSVFVKVNAPVVLIASKGGVLCLGQSTKLSVSGADVFEWSPATYIDNPNSATPNFTASNTGNITYVVTGRDKQNCFSSTASVTVKVYPIPTIKITSQQLVANAGIPVQISTSSSADVTKWKWSPETGLDNPNKAQPVLYPTKDGKYTVTATNDGNCSSSDEFSVSVLCDGKNLFVPNTFSPNNDGMNDVFFPHGKGVNNIKSIRIFNRWGEVVFEKMSFSANNPNEGWDGTFKGKEQGVDVYIYMMEVVCENGTINKVNGNITLIR